MRLDSVKRRLPTREQVLGNRVLRMFGDHIHDHNLWHFNRRSVARATAIGLFCAFLPMPFEMVPAALGAIIFRGNLPLSLAWVWISNPVTWVPLYGAAYLLGAWILGKPPVAWEQITVSLLGQQVAALWVGCLIVGTLLGAGGYFLINLLWRVKVASLWRTRRGKNSRSADAR